MKNKLQFLKKFLDKRKKDRQERRLRPIEFSDGPEVLFQGKKFINFCSNNSLGLASHPLLKERSIEFTQRYGTGAGASRLVCGSYLFHDAVEEKIAKLCGTEAALLFNSGFQANTSLLPALADRHTLIIADKNVHYSLLHGAISSQAALLRYRHNDFSHLKELLSANSGKFSRIWIVTESLFSMDGDRADLHALKQIADEFNALLYVDDAHALGLFGKNGMGLCSSIPGIDIIMGAFGKAGGASGAFVACTHEMREYLIHACAGIIYSTALPPSVVGAIDAALDLIPQYDQQRQQLNSNAQFLHQKLQQLGFNIGASNSHIIPLTLGTETASLDLSSSLERQGILALSIRPPTVPAGTSRVRLNLSAHHTQSHLDALLAALQS